MKMTTKQLNVFYAGIYLEGMASRVDVKRPYSECFKAVYEQFKNERGFIIELVDEHRAFAEWLQGLALDIPFSGCDILDLAKQTGYRFRTEFQEDKFITNYWDFMTMRFFFLLGREESWFTTNVDK